MDVFIRKLTPELEDDFLYYFDNDAFSDHEEWSACYCLQSHLSKEEDETCILKEERRQKAKELVREGIMTGYLVYDDDKIVGWCNAGDKSHYGPVCADKEFLTDKIEKGTIKVLYCMDIAPGYRGKGIANAVVERTPKKRDIYMLKGIHFQIQNGIINTEGQSVSMKSMDLNFIENRGGFSL